MTETATTAFGLIFLAYLLGSTPTAVLVCRAFNLPDPRQQGSGNPGATNVFRIGSATAASITLFGDISKGTLALCLSLFLETHHLVPAYCLVAVVAGHIFPLLSFRKGGKGVATTFGATLILCWPIALIQLGVWIACAFISRFSSLAALAAALITPLSAAILTPEYLQTLILVSGLLVYSHRSNIYKLYKGIEPRL